MHLLSTSNEKVLLIRLEFLKSVYYLHQLIDFQESEDSGRVSLYFDSWKFHNSSFIVSASSSFWYFLFGRQYSINIPTSASTSEPSFTFAF